MTKTTKSGGKQDADMKSGGNLFAASQHMQEEDDDADNGDEREKFWVDDLWHVMHSVYAELEAKQTVLTEKDVNRVKSIAYSMSLESMLA